MKKYQKALGANTKILGKSGRDCKVNKAKVLAE